MAEITPYRRRRSRSNLPVPFDWPEKFFSELTPSRLFREWMPTGTEEEVWIPSFDVSEKDKAYIVKADIPGVDPKSLDINMTGNVLTVSGEKKEEHEEKDKRHYLLERSFGSFSRSFTLPTDVNSEGIEANYKDGVLTMKIPKSEQAKQKKIEVRTE